MRLLTVLVSERASKLGQAAMSKPGSYLGLISGSSTLSSSPADSLFHCMDMPRPPTKLQLLPPIHQVSDQEGTQPTQNDGY